jgi:hypothetical protein
LIRKDNKFSNCGDLSQLVKLAHLNITKYGIKSHNVNNLLLKIYN